MEELSSGPPAVTLLLPQPVNTAVQELRPNQVHLKLNAVWFTNSWMEAVTKIHIMCTILEVVELNVTGLSSTLYSYMNESQSQGQTASVTIHFPQLEGIKQMASQEVPKSFCATFGCKSVS